MGNSENFPVGDEETTGPLMRTFRRLSLPAVLVFAVALSSWLLPFAFAILFLIAVSFAPDAFKGTTILIGIPVMIFLGLILQWFTPFGAIAYNAGVEVMRPVGQTIFAKQSLTDAEASQALGLGLIAVIGFGSIISLLPIMMRRR